MIVSLYRVSCLLQLRGVLGEGILAYVGVCHRRAVATPGIASVGGHLSTRPYLFPSHRLHQLMSYPVELPDAGSQSLALLE